MEKFIDTVFTLLGALAIPCAVLAVVLQPIWQAKREKKLAEELKVIHEAGNTDAIGAIVDDAMRDNLEIAARMKNLRRGG
jgi:hypothetical protein